jgi:hypothetical protein
MPSAKDLVKPRAASNGTRFTIGDLKVGGLVPCPLCGTWVSAGNNARHYKDKHDGKTPKEILTIPEYRAKALEMAEAKRTETGEK